MGHYAMNSYRASRPSNRPLDRYFCEIITGLVVLVVALLSLAPYDFLSPPGLQRAPKFFTTEISQTTLSDTIANIALYMPLGILLTTVFRRRFGHLIPGVLVTLLCGAALSACLEFLQAYSPSRVSSLIDLVANIVGAAVGAAIASASGSLVPSLLGALLHEIRHRPAAAELKLYCALLFVFATMPFAFSFDVQRLAEVYKNSNFIPFATPPAEIEAQTAAGTDGGRAGELGRWMGMRRGARWAVEATAFAILALMMELLLRLDYRFSRRAAFFLVSWLCGLWALLLTIVQLPVATRAIDTTDLVFRFVGVGLGLVLARPLHGDCASNNGPTPSVFTPRLLRVGCALATIYIIYTGVIPLSFDFRGDAFYTAISSAAFMPFTAYSFARYDAVFSDLSDKVAAYAVLAGLLAARRSGDLPHGAGARFWQVLLICVSLSSIIEVVQAFIPIRVSSLTDPILAAIGCVLGFGVQRTIFSLFHFANTHELVGPEEPAPMADRPPPGLTDRLIATLAEPHPDAPVEKSPVSNPTSPSK